MNHSFQQALDGTDKCARCKYPSLAHTDNAVCEFCPNPGKVEIRYGNMLMCEACWEKEQNLQKNNNTPEAQQGRVDAMTRAMETSKKIDSSIEVRSDVFNAATTAIVDLKKVIDENPDITNKPFALAQTLTERFNHFKKVVFDANEAIIEATNNQKAIQVYLNNLANSLRTEEREKLKLQDINYQPTKVKPVKTVKPITTAKPAKLDQKELKKYALELGVSLFTLQMVCVSQSLTPEQAATKLKKSIDAAKGTN
jgi:hypothetical protein